MEKFPAGNFKVGDLVRLTSPEESAGSFDNAAAVMEVTHCNYFRTYELPIYSVREVGESALCVTPFRDADLTPNV